MSHGRRPGGGGVRPDLQVVADMVAPGRRVLDVGCMDGTLLAYLGAEKGVDGRGMELSQAGVNACVARGLSVIQGDADTDLSDYPSASFDYAILSQTLQATRRPDRVLVELLRIGKQAIVSFPNFGYWRVRLALAVQGRMPVTKSLDRPWYETPNIHFCTIKDFVELCHDLGIRLERRIAIDSDGRVRPFSSRAASANLFAEQAVCLLSKPAR